MSLRGRHIIDRIKYHISHRFTLPCPPYGKPTYWDGVYKKLGPNDIFEWGTFDLEDLLQFQYNPYKFAPEVRKFGFEPKFTKADDEQTNSLLSTTFGEAIGIPPGDQSQNKKIMLLGCGNSRLGEDMIQHGWSGPILQVDVSQKVVSDMSQRCSSYVSSGVMDFIHDDATELNAFEDNSIHAVVDKGLTDALFCAEYPIQLKKILESVYRVLIPGGKFVVFSYSRPEYLMWATLKDMKSRRTQMWRDVNVWDLDYILMYRYEKNNREEKIRLKRKNAELRKISRKSQR